MKREMPVKIRAAMPEDAPYVYATWLKSQRRQGDRAEMRNRVYFEHEKRRIGGILSRSACFVAVNPEDETHLYGYVCASFFATVDLSVVHFLFVKPAYRKLGVGSALMRQVSDLGRAEIAITAVSPDIVRLKERWKLVFNPYLLETNFV